jgi:uncharacterized protein (TIGR03067 family)
MRILRNAALMLALVGLAVLTGCQSSEQREADKKAMAEEMKKFEGKWRLASREGDTGPDDVDDEDKPKKVDDEKGLVYEVEDGVLIEKFNNEVYSRKKMTLHPKSDPKRIDLVRVDEKNKPITYTVSKKRTGKKKGTTTTKKEYKEVGVYKIEGDKLTLAMSWNEKDRPTGFTRVPGGYVMTLTRSGGAKGDTDKDKEKKEDKDKEKKEDKDKNKKEDKDKEKKEDKDKDKKDKKDKKEDKED